MKECKTEKRHRGAGMNIQYLRLIIPLIGYTMGIITKEISFIAFGVGYFLCWTFNWAYKKEEVQK